MLQSFHCSTQPPFLGFFGWHPSFASSLQTLLLASRILIPWLFLSSAGFYDMGISHCLRRGIIHIANDLLTCPRSTIPQSFSDHHLLRGGRTLIKRTKQASCFRTQDHFFAPGGTINCPCSSLFPFRLCYCTWQILASWRGSLVTKSTGICFHAGNSSRLSSFLPPLLLLIHWLPLFSYPHWFHTLVLL